MARGKKARAGFEVGHRHSTPPFPAIVGPLLGLGYIITLPFVGLGAFVLAAGYRGSEWLATMWSSPTQAAAGAQEKTRFESAGFRELIQPLIDRIHCEFMVVDLEFRITQYYLPLVCHDELLERTAIGRRCFEVSHGRSRRCGARECECPVRGVLETNGQVAVKHYHENRFGRKDVRRAVEVVAYPVRDSEGNITHVAELICDAANA